MAESDPQVIVLAGPNGAGKTTASPWLLRGAVGVRDFVNADDIARGLSAFNPERVAVTAGKLMLRRLRELASANENFAFETTLATRVFAPWLKELMARGYSFHLLFLYLPDAQTAVDRVARRVIEGGHSVPEETIRRRYDAGLRNFFELYKPIAMTWRMYNGSTRPPYRLIAKSVTGGPVVIRDRPIWERLEQQYGKP